MASKRKRAPTLTEKPVPLDAVQPSSRDASEEDTADPVLQEVVKDKQRASSDTAAKRPEKRSRSGAEPGFNGAGKEQKPFDGESVSSADDDAVLNGVNGEAAVLSMEPPPKAGTKDPEGYHTNPPPTDRPVRIYADGVFDLFHLGHMRQLQQAKQAFPEVHLMVGVTGDKETHRRKGLTVLSGKERAETVRHCRWVDEVIEDCPWIINVDFIDKHEIDYVAHDDIPYGANEGDDIYAPIKRAGKFLVTERTEGVSTTGIITKIVRDYDQYIARQLKRGTRRQELNVSWLKKNELDIKRNMAELRNNIRTNWTQTGQEIGRELQKFWQGSRPSSPAPSLRAREPDGATSPTFPGTIKSPSPLTRLGHLDTAATRGQSSDFAAGYSLGLIGGVRSWMSRERRTLNDSNRPPSPDSPDGSDSDKSPRPELLRGRTKENVQDEVDAQVEVEMKSPRHLV